MQFLYGNLADSPSETDSFFSGRRNRIRRIFLNRDGAIDADEAETFQKLFWEKRRGQ